MTSTASRTCCQYPCSLPADWCVYSRGSERLHESWVTCTQHVPATMAYLIRRDNSLGLDTNRVCIVELPAEE